jgi:hypothetical protein
MAAPRKRVPDTERKIISIQRLKELMDYDPEAGRFTRIGAARPQSAHYAGKPIGHLKHGSHANGGGYRLISVEGRRYRAHHLAWFYMTGEWPQTDIDHINGDRDDNRWCNLRSATRSQNIANMKTPSNNTSGIKGVSWSASHRKWRAQIGIGKCANGYYYTKFLGRFDTKEEAAEAYRVAAEARFGEFARLA